MKLRNLLAGLFCAYLVVFSSGCNSNKEKITVNQNVIWAIQPQYIGGKSFSNGVAAIYQKDGACFINKEGNLQWNLHFDKIPIRFSELSPGFRHGIAIVENDGIRKYLLRSGQISDRPYSEAYWSFYVPNNQSLVPVAQGEKYGLINLQDICYIPPVFDAYSLHNDGTTILTDVTNQNVIVSADGKLTYTCTKGEISNVAEGIGFLRESGQYIDLYTGNVLASIGRFDDGKEFSDGLSAVKLNEKYGYINMEGELIIPLMYKDANTFSSGYAVVEDFDESFLIINSDNNISAKINCDKAGRTLHEGMLTINRGGKWGIVDNTGKVVLKPQYSKIEWNENGYFLLTDKRNRIGLYNPNTTILVKPNYEKILPLSEDHFLCEKSGRIELIDAHTGRKLTKGRLFWLGNYGEGLIAVQETEDGKFGYIDYNGNWIIAPQFDRAAGFREGLAAVCYDIDTGYIANPLIYTSWKANELHRAQDLGFNQERPMDAIDTFFSKFDMDTPEEIASLNLENSKGFINIDKALAANLTEKIAKAIGENTNCFISEFDDIDYETDISSAISYSTSIGVIEAIGSKFHPQEEVTSEELAKILLRLYEYMLDADVRQHPEVVRLAHSLGNLWT